MLNIEFCENLSGDTACMIDDVFDKLAEENGVVCGYETFAFTAYEDGKTVGVIKGHSYYNEVHIGELAVVEEYRKKHIGTRLRTCLHKPSARLCDNLLSLPALKILEIRQYSCGFLPCHRQNLAANPHTSLVKTGSY